MRRHYILGILLVVVTLATFWQVSQNEFLNYDDDLYVTDNAHVRTGLTSESIIWTFTTGAGGNWHPLTWISHMLDAQLYGLNAWGHHLTNLLLHIANTVLLFLVLSRMTKALWQSAFVAALFALHPLHVESVAWVAERKDLLSTFFWILTIWAYIRYVDQPVQKRFSLVVLSLALGLMAKPMLVTLPFVLLLLDYWPLNRFQLERPLERNPEPPPNFSNLRNKKSLLFSLVREKRPLFALAAVSGFVTIFVQQRAGAVESWEVLPLAIRIGNALVSYLDYIKKMIWPSGLAVFYPHPGSDLSAWQAVASGLVLLCLTALLIWGGRKRPYLAVGWLWYVGTLVPVIGVVQVGAQALADRYTYIPLIGLFIIIAWGVPDLIARWHYRKTMFALSAAVVILVLMMCTRAQLVYWHDSKVVFEHALRVTDRNYLAHANIGLALADEGKIAEAINHYSETLRIQPNHGNTHNNLGIALYKQGNTNEAISHYSEALRINPRNWNAHVNLGLALADQGRSSEAIAHYFEALRLNPSFAGAHYNLGTVLYNQGQMREAIVQYREAVRLEPDYWQAHYNLGLALHRQGEISEAIEHYTAALRITPDNAEAYYNRGIAHLEQEMTEKAVADFSKALQLKPEYPEAHNNLGVALYNLGKIEEAISHYSEAVRLKPDYSAALKNFEVAKKRLGQTPKP